MTTVSLFCGAGGESAGKALALADLGLTADVSHAVNHWDLAVQVHGHNFPSVQVHQEDITQVTAATYGLERISLLWASPSCVHFSRARGAKPKEDQQRSHAHEVLDRWIRVAKVDVLLVENVPEFKDWGPLDDEGQPIQSRKGEFFRDFIRELKELGYSVEFRVLCAADYGDPTTRRRFFLQAVKDGIPITWPEPSHRDPTKPVGLFDRELPPWRTAAECIDWTDLGRSIFGRKKPLAENTLKRIAAGFDRYVLHGTPYVVETAEGLVASLLVQYHSTFVGGKERTCSLEAPLPTLDTSNRYGLVVAFLAKNFTGVVGSEIRVPLGTITAKDHHGLVVAFLVSYYGTINVSRPDEPLDTITTLARHGLVTVVVEGRTYSVADIRYRMLKSSELAPAMGFPSWYRFERRDGGKLSEADKVKMIGNACPVGTVAALIRNVLVPRAGLYRGVA